MSDKVLAIVGPTAVGKSGVAIRVAKELGGEIVSADSMQIYRGMDIGTAKPSSKERSEIEHHLIDVVGVSDEFSASMYQELAREAISEIVTKSKLPMVVGGSGLYVRAALDDLKFAEGEIGTEIRKKYETDDDREKLEIWNSLKSKDPEAAKKIPYQNHRRVVRALEVIENSGELYSKRLNNWGNRRSVYDTVFVGLRMERERLYKIIDKRVDEMISAGLPEEVNRVTNENSRLSVTAAQALGYKELFNVGQDGLDAAIEEIKRRTRRLAKRQMTWFGRDDRVNWIDTDNKACESVASDIIDLVSRRGFIVR